MSNSFKEPIRDFEIKNTVKCLVVKWHNWREN